MSSKSQEVEALLGQKYRHGFVTDIESDSLPPGLDEDVVRAISLKKKEPKFLLDWRLQAYAQWLKMREPRWAHVRYPLPAVRGPTTCSIPPTTKCRS